MAQDSPDEQIFNDAVHRTITLDPLLVKIIDTPEFQRLRNIKQLGAAYRVYPAAAHNRFEHSIGVGYLAGVFIEKLAAKQPDLEITPTEKLCVKIAGLCHDIGHGPFSHLFDKEFREATDTARPDTKHEKISNDMIKRIYDNMPQTFNANGINDEELKIIYGLIDPENADRDHIRERPFLYQIVSNQNGIDVDRWDYFARDCLQLGLGYSFDYRRCMEVARVIDRKICFRDKEAVNIFNMFVTRYNLYRCAYFHATNSAIQLMIADAFAKVKNTLKFEGTPKTDGTRVFVPLLDIHTDMEAYMKATDSIYYDILNWSPEGDEIYQDMMDAQALLKRIEKRDFYQLVDDQILIGDFAVDKKSKLARVKKNVCTWIENQNDLQEYQLKVQAVDIGFGATSAFPLKNVLFFRKSDLNTPYELKEDEMPEPLRTMKTHDIRVRVFSTLQRTEYEAIEQGQIDAFKENLKHLVKTDIYTRELTIAEINEQISRIRQQN